MKLQKGFTLIEVLVAMIILAILASIALPAYQDYVVRGKIPEATSALSTQRVRLEQYFQDNLTYAGFGCAVAGTKYFTVSCTTLTPTTYVLQAQGIVGGAMDGFTYTIDQANAQGSTIAAPASADWRVAGATCWVTKKGGQC
jgi:type IV pilus assembly protein PilE